MATSKARLSKVVSPAEWAVARKQLLVKEKEFSRLRDELSRLRRELPWEKIDKNYVFDGPAGKEKLADLFRGKSQLIIYHFMFGPDWQEGCPSCSYVMDHVDGSLVHLAQRDVAFAAISHAPIAKLEAFRKRMGWKFHWVSSHDTDFNFDYHVSFTKEEKEKGKGKVEYNYEVAEFPSMEAPGISVFYKDQDGQIFHTYSTFARGLDILVGTYNHLDLTPKGRDEDSLPFTMAWLRHHDRYETGQLADASNPYWPENAAPQS